jgi:hypothetical protein
MTVHDGTVEGTVQKLRKGQKWHFDPKMAILALFSSFLNVACVLSVQTNDRYNNERKRKGKGSQKFVLTRIKTSTFTAKKHLTVGLHSDYSGRSPRPSGRRHCQF